MTKRKKAGTHTKRKTGTKRKTAAKRKRASVHGPAATASIGGMRFSKSTCHSKKSEAQKAAEHKREAGSLARVLKSGKGYCVYTRGKTRRRAA